MLLVVVALAGHDDRVRHQEGRVEAHTELANEVGRVAGAFLQLGEELTGAGLGDRTQVLDQLGLGHADTAVRHVQHLVLLVHL